MPPQAATTKASAAIHPDVLTAKIADPRRSRPARVLAGRRSLYTPATNSDRQQCRLSRPANRRADAWPGPGATRNEGGIQAQDEGVVPGQV